MKIVKEAAVCAVVIFVFNLILELLFNLSEFFESFEKGFILGVGYYLLLLLSSFLIVLIIMVIARIIPKLKSNNKR
ncbi:hypothetical protein XI25_24600 [Paenibacillus sp. DMB20]|nr:hypothetical protein XI25_24600 [Paenibacillus sp. DMB20]